MGLYSPAGRCSNQVGDAIKKQNDSYYQKTIYFADYERVLKDRKKIDKAFIDSQEKAFWNIIRPEVCCFFLIILF